MCQQCGAPKRSPDPLNCASAPSGETPRLEGFRVAQGLRNMMFSLRTRLCQRLKIMMRTPCAVAQTGLTGYPRMCILPTVRATLAQSAEQSLRKR